MKENKIRRHSAEEIIDLLNQIDQSKDELNEYKGRVAKLTKDGFITSETEKALNYPSLYLDDLYNTNK